eukprot:2821903-Ditylum_brightwellii.AAC.1
MSSNSTKKPFVELTPEFTKASTPDSSMNYGKSTGKNKNNTLALFSTVITPQNDKENAKQADIKSTPINKPSNLPSTSLRMTPVVPQCLNSTTTGDMNTIDINSELPSSGDEHTQ